MNRKLLSLALTLVLVLGLAAAFAEAGIGTAATSGNSFSYLDESVMTMYVYTDNGQGLKVWLDTSGHKLSILTELACTTDIERQLLQAQSQMNVCIGRHRAEIVNLSNHNINNV